MRQEVRIVTFGSSAATFAPAAKVDADKPNDFSFTASTRAVLTHMERECSPCKGQLPRKRRDRLQRRRQSRRHRLRHDRAEPRASLPVAAARRCLMQLEEPRETRAGHPGIEPGFV